MFLTRLIFVSMHIYLSSSILPLQSPSYDDVIELNKILKSEGWAALAKFKITGPNYDRVRLNVQYGTVTEENYQSMLNKATKDISSIYESLLACIHELYFSLTYDANSNKIQLAEKFGMLKQLIDTIKKFEPLSQCMKGVLKYFGCNNENTVLKTLEDERSFNISTLNEFNVLCNEIVQNDNMNDGGTMSLINKIYEHLEKILNNPRNYSTRTSELGVTSYIRKLTNPEDTGYLKRHIDPYHSDFLKMVQGGIKWFCEDFGYNQNWLTAE